MKYLGLFGILGLFFLVLTEITPLPQKNEKSKIPEEIFSPIIIEPDDKGVAPVDQLLKLNCECHRGLEKIESTVPAVGNE